MSADRARKLLDDIAGQYGQLLGTNLIGVYEHGSLSFGCFTWKVSDIDFLVVVRREPGQQEKEEMIRLLMDRLPDAPEKGFEMSVICGRHLRPFVYPTPFSLHYSNAHLEACRADISGYCRSMNGEDKDLAAHCMVTKEKGRRVRGAEIDEVFGEVPRKDYLDSILGDVENACGEIEENPVYVSLNLCRVLAAIEEDAVLSKDEGGRWGLQRLDDQWKGFIHKALNAYSGGAAMKTDPDEARRFAGHMLERINKAVSIKHI